MKKFKAIFFDWDGTAVVNRMENSERIVKRMKALLKKGVYLFVISGTTYKNIDQGKLHHNFTKEELSRLYLGLARGNISLSFDENGEPKEMGYLPMINERKEEIIKIHDVAYKVHQYLFNKYSWNTDIYFSRPGYIKLDLLVDSDRGDQLYYSNEDIINLRALMKRVGYQKSLYDLMQEVISFGKKEDIDIKVTTDAKFLEIGTRTKSESVDMFITNVLKPKGILVEECGFFGDEYSQLDENIFGSDYAMLTENSQYGTFYDVSDYEASRLDTVQWIGGGVQNFIDILEEQAK